MSNLNNVIKELSAVYKAGGYTPVRFSITLDDIDNQRVENLAESLSISKQDLIGRLLMAAVTDMEDAIKGTVDNTPVEWSDDDLVWEIERKGSIISKKKG